MHERGRTERRFAGITEIQYPLKSSVTFCDNETESSSKQNRADVADREAVGRATTRPFEREVGNRGPVRSEQIETTIIARIELRAVTERIEYMPMIQFGASIDRRRGANSRWCNAKNSAVAASACHLQHPHVSVHGVGIREPRLSELSRFIGSAMFNDDCIFISCSCSHAPASPCRLHRALRVRCAFDAGRVAFRLRFSLSERVSIPHFGHWPGSERDDLRSIGQV